MSRLVFNWRKDIDIQLTYSIKIYDDLKYLTLRKQEICAKIIITNDNKIIFPLQETIIITDVNFNWVYIVFIILRNLKVLCETCLMK